MDSVDVQTLSHRNPRSEANCKPALGDSLSEYAKACDQNTRTSKIRARRHGMTRDSINKG